MYNKPNWRFYGRNTRSPQEQHACIHNKPCTSLNTEHCCCLQLKSSETCTLTSPSVEPACVSCMRYFVSSTNESWSHARNTYDLFVFTEESLKRNFSPSRSIGYMKYLMSTDSVSHARNTYDDTASRHKSLKKQQNSKSSQDEISKQTRVWLSQYAEL